MSNMKTWGDRKKLETRGGVCGLGYERENLNRPPPLAVGMRVSRPCWQRNDVGAMLCGLPGGPEFENLSPLSHQAATKQHQPVVQPVLQ